jgi:hypothetical protein
MTVSHMYALLHKTMRYQWGFRYLFFIIKLDNFFWQILLQDKYNIGEEWLALNQANVCQHVYPLTVVSVS